MRGHPVENDADTGAVRAIDKSREPGGVAKTGGRRIESRRLIAPRRVIGMFADRQELDMGEAHVNHIGNEFVGHLIP